MTTRFKGNELALTFGDDGTGMSYEHARKYLFTLYASSKEKEEKSAGRFGVGFWSGGTRGNWMRNGHSRFGMEYNRLHNRQGKVASGADRRH